MAGRVNKKEYWESFIEGGCSTKKGFCIKIEK